MLNARSNAGDRDRVHFHYLRGLLYCGECARNGHESRLVYSQNKGNGGEISKDWAVQGWPTVVILDSEMKIHYRGHDGEAATKVAKALVEKMTEDKK